MATVLVNLWRAARQRTKKIPDFEYRLEMVRADLGTDAPAAAGLTSMAAPLHESHEKDDVWRNLETLVLLDEFLKEIYSILQATRVPYFYNTSNIEILTNSDEFQLSHISETSRRTRYCRATWGARVHS